MIKIPAGYISKKDFRNQIRKRGLPQGFITKRGKNLLRDAGLNNLLTQTGKVSKVRAQKAWKLLVAEKEMSSVKRVGQIWQTTLANVKKEDQNVLAKTQATKKLEQQQGLEQAKRQNRIRAHIRIDQEREMDDLIRSKDVTGYDQRSALGQSLIAELNQEQQTREEKIQDQREKREKFANPKSLKPNKPELPPLPDLDIG